MEPSSHHRTVPQSAAPQETTVTDTSADAELARRLAAEGSRRQQARSSHPATAMERSSHHRPVPQPATGHEASVPDTSADAELARRLASEGSRRLHARSSHPAAAMEQSSHHRLVPQPAPVEEATVPDTSADAELARRLASEGSRRQHARTSHPAAAMERSSHHRPVPHAAGQEARVPDTSADAELARRLASEGSRRPHARSSHPAAATERSSHQRPVPQPEPVQYEIVPDTSADAELARRLASEGSRRTHARSSHPAAAMERSSHHRTVPQSATGPEASAPDTSADAELARRLASEGSRRQHARSSHPAAAMERSSHHRPVPLSEGVQYENLPDTSADAELARLLAQAEAEKIGVNLTRGTVPGLSEAPDPRDDDIYGDKEIARRLGEAGVGRHHLVTSIEAPVVTVPSVDDDEALARKLEQELMDEEIALRMQGSNTNRRRRTSYLARKHAARREQGGGNSLAVAAKVGLNSALPSSQDHVLPRPVGSLTTYHSSTDGESGDDKIVRETGPSRTRAPSRHRSNSSDSDGDLQRAGREQAYLHDTKRPRVGSNPRSRDGRGIRNGIAKSSNRRRDMDIVDLHEFSDRDLALRLDQELRDEALAREFTVREAKRISVYQVKAGTSSGRKTWTCRRMVALVLPIIVVFAAVAGLVYMLSGNSGQTASPSSPAFQDQDPFNGVNTGNANRWNNKGAGLQLEVLNALESKWDALFSVAIKNWDSGNPDALTLSVSKVSVDKDCSQVTGKLKVCNGDYGDTKWRGINQVIISNGFIVSSSARLNEFYLATADESQRQYTICHEIGHGFGLPHTDENFYNADLGNCMISGYFSDAL
ncbi:hypothetical protein MHU86_2159 [Fragilaria crotonensis]|nr:hypothetical protein MHU86_2159 [Fragilaria crotonensis]